MTETYTSKDFVLATGGAEFIAYTPGSPEHSETYASERSDEYQRFEDLASKLISVPKSEVSEG